MGSESSSVTVLKFSGWLFEPIFAVLLNSIGLSQGSCQQGFVWVKFFVPPNLPVVEPKNHCFSFLILVEKGEWLSSLGSHRIACYSAEVLELV